MDIITIDAPVSAPARKVPVKRQPVSVTCPNCHSRQDTRATTVTCGSCGLRAPISAFSGSVATRKFGAPRAFTIRGDVD